MSTTFLDYRIYAANLPKSLQRVAAEPQNANDQKYFEANIGKVKSVDDFLNNFRLFTYAMKAYGLSDLGNAKGLMKQVLESDLTNTSSLANRLNDSRYKDFAKAFNFTTSGGIGTTGQLQTSGQQQDLLARINPQTSQVAGLQASLSSVTSVASLEANKTLYAQVLKAYGIDSDKTPVFQVTLALESSLADPKSFANRPDTAGDTTYAKFRALAADFNFASDGSIGSQTQLQSAQSVTTTQTAYMSKIATDAASQSAAKTESAYYAKMLPTLTSVDQIVANPRLVAYVKTAFKLDASLSTTQLRNVLTSNLLDSKSVANTLGVTASTTSTGPTPYQLLASAFSIGTDGTAWDHGSALSSSLTSITAAYKAAVGTDMTATATQTETDYFTSRTTSLKSVSGLLADSRLVAYFRKAFDLPATGTTTAQLGSILASDLLDAKSPANTLGSAARKLAAAFNFAPNGLVYGQRPIENTKNVTATTTAYQGQAGTTTTAKAAAQAETDYFTSTVPRLKSVDDLVADKRLVAYIGKAYNLTDVTPATLRQVLTSDLFDPKSKANTLGGGYQTLAAAFDISKDGSITHAADRAVQTKTGIAATHAAYLEQAMESDAGDNNEGVRLALYFRSKAPTITSAYQILADKALTKVVQTMLGLSSNSSKADIDSQARAITSKLNLADLKDPAKVDKLVARFAALYDLTADSSSDTSSTTLTL